MASTTILTRDQNTYTANACIDDEILFVDPSIADDIEEIEMNIAEDGMDFIFDMLSDLSANRGAYAIREAYSNAYDATVVGGDMTSPIEIVLQNVDDEDSLAKGVAEKNGMLGAFSMFASITDHGCGMSTDDVKKYFTQYGGSNKRDGKSTIGSKGLGSKAPLACSDLFTVESTKDGITTTATIERKQGRNCATVLAEQTDKDNGTTVTIPLTDMKTFNQMKECVENIVKWNLDATIVFNGEITEPSFTEETLGSFIAGNVRDLRGSSDYIYLGNVPVAVDEDGNAVSFRMWQKESIFPSVSVESIDLNLAGVRYPLRSWRNDFDAPHLIVAGEPGFLNFTPSRDEIKDDEVRSHFIAAIDEALTRYDFTNVVAQVLDRKDVYEMRDWMSERRHRVYGANADSDGNMKVTMSSPSVSYDIPASVFVKDGIDYSCLFLGSDDMASAKVMCSCPSIWSDSVAFKVASQGYADSSTCRPDFRTCSKKDIAEHGSDSFRSDVLFRSVMSNLDGYSKVFVITGAAADGQKRFVNNEKTIRDAYGSPRNTLYILCDEGIVLTDMDKVAFGGSDNVEYVTLDEMLEAAREYRRANRAATTKSGDFSKNLAERYGRIRCFDLKNTAYQFNDENYYSVGAYHYTCFDYTSVCSFEDLAKKNIIMLVDTKDNNWDEIGAAVTILAAMSANDALAPSVENLLVMPKMNANDIKAFVKAGGKFFSDIRKKPSAYIGDTMLSSTKGLNVVSRNNWNGSRVFCYFEVDPALVMSTEAASELSNADATYWHVAENMADAVNAKAIMSLLPDTCSDYKALEPAVAKVLDERNAHRYTELVVFKAESDAASDMACKRYDKLVEVIKDVFQEIPLDTFFHHSYNTITKKYEIEANKNAEMMLAPVIEELVAKQLFA